ncbi:uncharacterized protein LOC106664830 [Cimex lectularius]|uniref:CPR type cuticle protein n=1 Tax=Cimex lectularius TaxID=79782 RepID=A0A8I6RJ66_CIMLE|nr:uncharacterized protein LOC106664830 [Cimex lectularius]
MAALKFVVLAALVACAFAAEEERVKKDVLLGTVPYAYTAYPHAYTYGYDDGKYFPGKYEKAYVAPAYPYHLPAVSTYSALPAVPAVQPYNYAYGAYPYNQGAYPYYRQYVY